MPSLYFVYLLRSLSTPNSTSTYVGFSTNPRRRLRQHNGELKAGAKHTAKYRPWMHTCIVGGFPDKIVGLMFEWQWQHPKASRIIREYVARGACRGKGHKKQLEILHAMLQCPLWRQLDLTVNFVDAAAAEYFATLQQRLAKAAGGGGSSSSSSSSSSAGAIRTVHLDADEVDVMHRETKDKSAVGLAVATASLMGERVGCAICRESAADSSRAIWCCPGCGCAQHVVCSGRKGLGLATDRGALSMPPAAPKSSALLKASAAAGAPTAPPSLVPAHFCCHSCGEQCSRAAAARLTFFPGALEGREGDEDDEDEDDDDDDDDEDAGGGHSDASSDAAMDEGNPMSQLDTQGGYSSDEPF